MVLSRIIREVSEFKFKNLEGIYRGKISCDYDNVRIARLQRYVTILTPPYNFTPLK